MEDSNNTNLQLQFPVDYHFFWETNPPAKLGQVSPS